MSNDKPISLLFVCLGNICRSTMAEGTFQHLLSTSSLSSLPPALQSQATRISEIDSAGTGGYHIGAPPDSRTMSVLRKHGITDYKHGARQVELSDFVRFDYIFGMDGDNVEDLEDERERAVVLAKRIRASSSSSSQQAENANKTNLDGGTKRTSRRSRSEEEFTTALKKADEDGTCAARGGDGLGKVFLYGAFGGSNRDEEVNDPYYGGNKGFDTAFEQLERFGKGFLGYLAQGKSG